jgi:hypothetical protein
MAGSYNSLLEPTAAIEEQPIFMNIEEYEERRVARRSAGRRDE